MVKEIARNIFSRDWFRIIYLVVSILYFMPSTMNIELIPSFVVIGWGGMIIVYDFFTKRIMFQNKYWKYFMIIIFVYIISILLNHNHALFRGVYNLVFLFITFFLVFPFDLTKSKEAVTDHFKKLNDIFIVLIFIGSTISLILFMFNVSYVLESNDIRQGFIESRLFGIYSSPNVGSVLGYISVMLSLINNIIKRGNLYSFNAFYFFNAIVQILFFILATSRGTSIIIISNIFLLSIFYVYPYFKRLTLNKGLSILTSFFILIGFLTFSNQTISIIRSGLSYVPGIVYTVSNPKQSDLMTEEEIIMQEEVGIEQPELGSQRVVIRHSSEEAEVTSGRLNIWRAGLDVVKQSPLFGITDPNLYRDTESTNAIDEELLSENSRIVLDRSSGNMHNLFIQILITSGIIGFVALGIYLIKYLFDIGKFVSAENLSTNDYTLYLLIFITMISFFAGELVESRLIFMNRNVVAIVFWYLSGVLNFYKEKSMQKNKTGIEGEK